MKTEEDPLDPRPPAAQEESLTAIRYLEQAVLGVAPIEGIVLRYGSLYGPGASDELVELVGTRALPIVGGGTGIWSFVHVDDAAAATVDALTRGAPGIYDIVDTTRPVWPNGFRTSPRQSAPSRPACPGVARTAGGGRSRRVHDDPDPRLDE